MKQKYNFKSLLRRFFEKLDQLPDKRIGDNARYSMRDIALGAFSVFFTQSPSFLSHQKSMKADKGQSNAETLFGVESIPSDNHIRDILDDVPPSEFFSTYDNILRTFESSGHLESFLSPSQRYLIPLDGTWYFSSKSIHCGQCLKQSHANGETTYYHSMIAPVIACPGKNEVIPLRPEFITPQDGQKKQDCETNAAKRWFDKNIKRYQFLKPTYLGDDLYSRQPMCQKVLDSGSHFIFVCKPQSHKTLYEWVELLEKGKDIHKFSSSHWDGKERLLYQYSYANGIPLRDGEDALKVNWFDFSITNAAGKIIYKNSWITDHPITEKNLPQLVEDARSRWKVENENNNILKTKGYHLEHNFGHGKRYLSATLATLNILAFSFHTILMFVDEKFRWLRNKLPSRQSFFDDFRALSRYLIFKNWEHLMDFMIQGLSKKWDPLNFL